MKTLFLNKDRKPIVFILSTLLLYSCSGGTPQEPRKTLPRFFNITQNANQFESYGYSSCAFGQGTYYDVYTLNDDNFLTINLINSGEVDELIDLVNTYRPLTSMYLSEFAKMNKKGLLIDLRSNKSITGETEDFNISRGSQSAGTISIRYDLSSNGNANKIKQFMKTFSGFNIQKIN